MANPGVALDASASQLPRRSLRNADGVLDGDVANRSATGAVVGHRRRCGGEGDAQAELAERKSRFGRDPMFPRATMYSA